MAAGLRGNSRDLANSSPRDCQLAPIRPIASLNKYDAFSQQDSCAQFARLHKDTNELCVNPILNTNKKQIEELYSGGIK